MTEWGISIVIALQTAMAPFRLAMEGFSFLGKLEFLMLLVPIVYWCVSESSGKKLLYLLISAHVIGMLLKLLFHLPRPYWISEAVLPLSAESTYGMPSLHALSAMTIWPWLGSRATRKWWGVAIGSLIVLGISFSRIALGVHSPQDVFAGWAIGAVVFVVVTLAERLFSAKLARAGIVLQVTATMFVSALVVAFQALILWGLSSHLDPPEWYALASRIKEIAPRDPTNILLLAGTALGIGVGIAFQRKWARFPMPTGWRQWLLRLLVGFAGLLFFFRGLDMLIPSGSDFMGLFWKSTQAVISAFWLVFLAHWVFIKLKLAGEKPASAE